MSTPERRAEFLLQINDLPIEAKDGGTASVGRRRRRDPDLVARLVAVLGLSLVAMYVVAALIRDLS